MKNTFFTLIAFIVGLSLYGQGKESLISEKVKENIRVRVDNGVHPSIVLGVIEDGAVEFYSYGVKSYETEEVVTPHTVYEIGSISKTFTGTILAQMVLNGELNIDDPAQSLLPKGVQAPTRNGEEIKLYQLSNHTSSLPRMPDNMDPEDPDNPYADYTEDQLYAFLEGVELTRDIGSEYEYSNFAVGLLGHLLAEKRGTTYEALLAKEITGPLDMNETRIEFTPEMKANLATGYSEGFEVSNWDLSVFAGAGAIRSTASDLMKYLAANLGVEESELYPAMQLTQENSGAEDSDPMVGLGWHIVPLKKKVIIAHGGATGGYSTFAAFIKGGSTGVVVLTNCTMGVEDIGLHILEPKNDLENPKPSVAIEVRKTIDENGPDSASEVFWSLKKNEPKKYSFGEVELNSLGYSYLAKEEMENAMAVFRLNVRAFPKSWNAYDSYAEGFMMMDERDSSIVYYKKSLELNPANTNGIQMLEKLGVSSEGLVNELILEEDILARYTGVYQLAPEFKITITQEGTRLWAQATGQSRFELFARSESEFFLKAVDAQVMFNSNDKGEVESLTLFQGGREMIGMRE